MKPYNLYGLTKEFKPKVEELLALCAESGYLMRPYYTLRTPFEQAKLWRQSRTMDEIIHKMSALRIDNARFLADCISVVGPQYGRKVTNAIPGLSWHQYGEAVDCFWVIDGGSEWSTRLKVNGINGYHNYAKIAKKMGLTCGGSWKSRDYNHVQLSSHSSPQKCFTLREIDEKMASIYSDQ